LASKPKNGEQLTTKKMATSSLSVADLNLSEGLAGTLIDRIVNEKNKENRAITFDEVRDKHRATARQSLENHEKRCSAGLITAAG
jgi:hypothetical protein